MKLLLDTHTFLWFAIGDAKLSQSAKSLIEDPNNTKLISPASYWEIAIKISLGKYAVPKPYEEFVRAGIDDNGFVILPIEPRHTSELTTLPFHHRDPFDRLLIAQAIVEGLAIVGCDTEFDAYPVTRKW